MPSSGLHSLTGACDPTAEPFEFVRRLGAGRTGEVWLARDVARDRTVAIKVFEPAFVRDRAAFDALQRVHDAVAELRHPAILQMDMVVVRGAPSLVMQYASRGDASTLRGGRCEDVVRTVLPIAHALAELHRAGIVHRDVKASNVLLIGDRDARLADFDSAVLMGHQDSRAITPGSRYTMSPEALDGAAPLPANDVYGFGAMLYELLSGYPPFYPNVTPERIRNEAPRRIVARRVIPETMQDLIARCLRKSVVARPSSMEHVSEQLERVLEQSAASPHGDARL